ncbi:type IX secretion system membrane protein PorP/SprF [Flavobacterium sp. NRK F10]|uniref:PorP/SprF family type IX secretion system membrane protein n=1 Tax=Flavobacterium sp. NRK F10 TaxID=2954931 RepID=UPI002090F59C|nr:type IX secretion system membrane protein PorP/SprF [Flavobacterium sp. NRK F10]MCO6176469.1 type IX secretion system membrane protein PorP/SprF [Flavobacterium sp. NRK F10]
MKKIILIIFVLTSTFKLFAQQDSQFTNYMYNTVNINPAYAGSRGFLSTFILHRNQWVGLDGAPVTNTFALNTPIKNSKFGLGISFINDRIGPSDENSLAADISYTIPTSEKFKLSFGIKASANLLNIDWSKLNIYNPTDNLAQYNVDNKFSPNIGAGIYFHSDKTYFGFSVPNFLETKHFDEGTNLSSSSVASERMHYYFIAGHVFDLSQNIKFKPAALTKFVKGAPLQVDLSANFLFNEKFTAGLAYRWDAAFSALFGFQVSDSWLIGYAYDMEITKLANYNSGSHEIFLRFELFKNYDKVISPRFF